MNGYKVDWDKLKTVSLLLFLSSFIGYLEWGTDHAQFIFQIQLEFPKKFIENPGVIFHPFIFLPIIGQNLLALSILSNRHHTKLIVLGILCLIPLYILILIAGLLHSNLLMMASSLPFILLTIYRMKFLFQLKYNSKQI